MDEAELKNLERKHLVFVKATSLSLQSLDGGWHQIDDISIILKTLKVTRQEGEITGKRPDTSLGYLSKKKEQGPSRSKIREEGVFRQQGIPTTTLPVAIREQPFIVLLGDPGAGKTTSLHFLAHQIATGKLNLSRKPVPLFLSLRDIYQEIEKSGRFQDVLISAFQQIHKVDKIQAEKTISNWIGRGRLVLLLDGLDEVPQPYQLRVVSKIQDFLVPNDIQGCRIILTSRLADYRDIGDIKGFHEYLISPLSETEQSDYITKWFAVFTHKELDEESTKKKAVSLFRSLSSHPGLSPLMDNPLFLQMMVYTFKESEEIPESLSELFRNYFEEILWSRAIKRVERGVPPPSKEMVFEFLEIVAWELQHKHLCDLTDLKSFIKEQSVKTGEKELTYAEIDSVFKFIRNRMGVIAYDEMNTVKFARIPFQEYFLSRILRKRWENEWQTLMFSRLHHPSWREAILILSTMPSEDTNHLVERILFAQSSYERVLHRDLLLAGECYRRGAKISNELRQIIVKKIIALHLTKLKNIIERDYRHKRASIPPVLHQEHIINQIERIIKSFPDEDRKFIQKLLLSDKKRNKIQSILRRSLRYPLEGIKRSINFGFP